MTDWERTRQLVYASSFALAVDMVCRTSVELTEALYDMAHEHAAKTADEAAKAMERAKERKTT